MFVGDKDGAVAMMEHPEPPVRLADPHAGFIRGQRRAGHQPRLDQAGLRREGLPAGGKNVDQRALADLQAKQVAQHMAQSRQRNPLNGAQINHEGAQVRPERRHPPAGRRRRERRIAAGRPQCFDETISRLRSHCSQGKQGAQDGALHEQDRHCQSAASAYDPWLRASSTRTRSAATSIAASGSPPGSNARPIRQRAGPPPGRVCRSSAIRERPLAS